MIDRHKMLDSIKEEKRLREFFRKDIKRFLKNKKKEEQTIEESEAKLRKLIQKLITEVASTDVPDAQPHKNTGINVLEELLKNIIPIVEEGYKSLTSTEEQRTSFRAHILNAVENSLKPVEVVADLPHAEAGGLEEQELTVTVDDDEDEDKFIPVRDVDTEEETPEEEEDTFTVAGEDLTGRNFASITFNKVENQIIDAYESLANREDAELFYDYLLTNLKLYFDKFEDELQTNLTEPESPDYETSADEPIPEEEPAVDTGEEII